MATRSGTRADQSNHQRMTDDPLIELRPRVLASERGRWKRNDSDCRDYELDNFTDLSLFSRHTGNNVWTTRNSRNRFNNEISNFSVQDTALATTHSLDQILALSSNSDKDKSVRHARIVCNRGRETGVKRAKTRSLTRQRRQCKSVSAGYARAATRRASVSRCRHKTRHKDAPWKLREEAAGGGRDKRERKREGLGA